MAMASSKPSARSIGAANSSGRPSPSTKPRHTSSMRAMGRYSARRRTTSAALIERVVGPVGHRAVRRRAVDPEPTPQRALLVGQGGQAQAGRRVERHAARLGDHVVGADGVGLVLHEVLGAVRAARLLVGDTGVDERALRAEAGRGQLLHGHGHRARQVEHVDRAAAPQPAVDDLARERIVLPALLVHGHHVGVAEQAQARRARIAALDAAPRRSSARAPTCSARRRGRRPRGSWPGGRRCGAPRPTQASRR